MNTHIVTLVGLLGLASGIALAQEPPIVIQNTALQASFDSKSGFLSLLDKSTQRVFLKKVRLSSTGGVARMESTTNDLFGPGQAIVITYPEGNRDTVRLFANLPFALFQTTLHNGTAQAAITKKLRTLSATVELGQPPVLLKTLGTGGLHTPDKKLGSYVWLAVAEPQSRHGVILGWLTGERGSGVVFSQSAGGAVLTEAQIDYGRLRLEPGATEALETLAIGYFDDARLGLETWADTVAKVRDIHLPPQPTGYCTWYSRPHGDASDEKHLAEQAAFAAKYLAPFGFSVIQIDDHWQAGVSTNGPVRNFTTEAKPGPYPNGMKAAADNIKSLGLTPGLWFMPFAGTSYDPFYKDHQDWFVKNTNGLPYETTWGGTCLDMTQSGAREYLRGLIRRIANDWGYQYFKMDGLWTGTGTQLKYINDDYKDPGMDDAIFANPRKTNMDAYRDGLRLIRETAGAKVFILGCCASQNMLSYGGAFGLVDAMRIGPDNNSDWSHLLRGPTFGSRQYFLHGRVWYNDPDPLYVRPKVPLNHAQMICSWVALSGQMNFSSEWLPGLPPERLDLLKRTMPNHGLLPRPVDLFERPIPSLWLLTDTRRSPRRDVIGIFNWESSEQHFDYPLDRLGLDATKEYVAFDYWKNALMPSLKGRLQITVPAESCCILAVRPRADHPQLLSTSRHLTQGMVDVLAENWDEKKQILSGRSKVVGGDAYELRIVSAIPAKAIQLSSDGNSTELKSTLKQTDGLIRALIETPVSLEVNWSVQFK
jgi:hypothetical protein